MPWDNPGGTSIPSGSAAGDLSGNYPNPNVVGLHSIPVPLPSVLESVLTLTAPGVLSWGASPKGLALPVPPWDWSFGSKSFADTDSAWNITAKLPPEGNPLRRGSIWLGPGLIRTDVVNGRLLFQLPADSITYEMCLYPLTYEPDDAVCLTYTMDGTDQGGPSTMYLVWGQNDGSGEVDFNNCFTLGVAQLGVDSWFVGFAVIESGSGTTLYNTTISSTNCPWSASWIEGHSGLFTAWVGPNAGSLTRLGPDYSSAVKPELLTVLASCGTKPNTVFALSNFYRRLNTNF